MHIEMWPIGRVKPYPGNPRINAAAVDAVAKSVIRRVNSSHSSAGSFRPVVMGE
jgi:hypothetical protein